MRDGGFHVTAYPTVYNATRIPTLPQVSAIVRECQVALRGWYLPHVAKSRAAASFSEGFQSRTATGSRQEGFRLYRSGLFAWRGTYWEDAPAARIKGPRNGRRGISFISTIYSLTEFHIFLVRLYEKIAPEATVRIRIAMTGCQGRVLASYEPMVNLFADYMSQEDEIVQTRDIQVAELRA